MNEQEILKKKAGGRPSKCPELEKLNTLYCEFSAREIAEFYGVSVRTVRGWVYRARKKGRKIRKGDRMQKKMCPPPKAKTHLLKSLERV